MSKHGVIETAEPDLEIARSLLSRSPTDEGESRQRRRGVRLLSTLAMCIFQTHDSQQVLIQPVLENTISPHGKRYRLLIDSTLGLSFWVYHLHDGRASVEGEDNGRFETQEGHKNLFMQWAGSRHSD